MDKRREMNFNPPVCTCRNEGKPWEQDGVSYVSLDPACRVHKKVVNTPYEPVSAESVVGNWNGMEKVGE